MTWKGITPKEWEQTAEDKRDDALNAKRNNMTPQQYDNSPIDMAADKIGIAMTNAQRSKAGWPKIPKY